MIEYNQGLKQVIWIFIFSCLPLVNPISVLAADGGLNITTSPLPISLITQPGATVSAQLKVKNGGVDSEVIQAGLMKFSAFGEEGRPRLTDRETGDDYFDWVTFSEASFELKPNEWKTITLTINVPESAAFGYYYAVTFSRKDEVIADAPQTNKIVGATASLILLEVRVPNAIREIEVLEFSTPKRIYEFLPTNFLVKLKNKGNVHVAPRGNIFIDRWGQKDVAILNINELKGSVLPGTNRVFDSSWADGFPIYKDQIINNVVVTDSKGISEKKLTWDFSQVSKLRWGKYTANMLLVYDDGTRDVPIEAKVDFWIIPWRILGGVLLVTLLIGRGVYSIVKDLFKKNVK